MKFHIPLIIFCLTVQSVFAQQPQNVNFGVAGVPKTLAETRDYNKIFKTLKDSSVTIFFPTFQYQEVPKAKSLGYETDFLLPCDRDAGAFKALQKHNIKLLLSADLLYPRKQKLPSIENDPLAQILKCISKDNIAGILNYDEPAHNDIDPKTTKNIFQRVKSIEKNISVYMVHAPIIMDQKQFQGAIGRNQYLTKIKKHSQNADIIGFDLYPIPTHTAKIGLPNNTGKYEHSSQKL